MGFPNSSPGKESACNARDAGSGGLLPGSGRVSLRRARQPTPVFLPGESPRTEEPGVVMVHGVAKSWT